MIHVALQTETSLGMHTLRRVVAGICVCNRGDRLEVYMQLSIGIVCCLELCCSHSVSLLCTEVLPWQQPGPEDAASAAKQLIL